MKHYTFPKIKQYHQVLRDIKLQISYIGKDENDEAIYKEPDTWPIIKFTGRIKLHGCVSEDTEVLLSDGSTKPIRDLKVGTSIISFNEETNEFENDIIENVLSEELDKNWVELTLCNDYKLKCTEDHPIYTKNRGYVKAIELTNVDDIIIDLE